MNISNENSISTNKRNKKWHQQQILERYYFNQNRIIMAQTFIQIVRNLPKLNCKTT